MKEDRRNDLVPVTAIIAGAAVGVAVTVFSLLGIGDELFDRQVDDDYPEYLESVETDAVEHGMGPMGTMRGPTDLEWEVIRTYNVIQSMTATEPSDEVVDETLAQLWIYARRHPDNAYIQELLLKGIRVAQYYAFERGDFERADHLLKRFNGFAPQSMQYESTILESMRMVAQRLGQSCDELAARDAELRDLADRVSDSHEVEWIRREAREQVALCYASAGPIT